MDTCQAIRFDGSGVAEGMLVFLDLVWYLASSSNEFRGEVPLLSWRPQVRKRGLPLFWTFTHSPPDTNCCCC